MVTSGIAVPVRKSANPYNLMELTGAIGNLQNKKHRTLFSFRLILKF